MDELQEIINCDKVDVIAIAETLPKNFNKDTHPDDIKFVFKGFSNIQNNKGRGLCLFIKEGLGIVRLPDLEKKFDTSIFCKLKSSSEEFTLGLIYRSPSSSDDDNVKLLEQINLVCSKHINVNDRLLIMGDFNFPDIDWSHETCKGGEGNKAKSFLSTIHQNYLCQHVQHFTHFRPNTQPSLIDLVFTNTPDLINDIKCYAPIGNSHHVLLSFNILIGSPTCDYKGPTRYLLNKGDYNGMRQFVGNIDWNETINSDKTVDQCIESLEKVLNHARDTFIPKAKNFKSNNNKTKRTFSSPDTLHLRLILKRNAFKRYKQFPTDFNKAEYVYCRNKVNSVVRTLKRQKEAFVASEAKRNPKVMYQYIYSKTKAKESVPDLLKEDGTLTESDEEKSHLLNTFFSSVFTDEGDEPIPLFDFKTDSVLNDVSISNDDMFKVLSTLKVNKSPGPDGIQPRILSELAKELAPPLKNLFDKTLCDGILPSSWKEAEVRPIFKKGNKSTPGNYRPVSLTAIICKVFEKFIRDAMYSHLIVNNILSVDQFGFCQGRSCSLQLLVTINDWLGYLDNKVPVDAAYLDFRKAFDSVPHKRLLTKLKGYGIDGKVLVWVEDFLKNRVQYVSINGKSSEKSPVTSGVPQGSVLGPTLFIYFINDLPDKVKCNLKIFADDTKAYKEINSIEDKLFLQECIDELVEWTNKWLLKFNSDKCKVLHLGKNNPNYEYTINHDNVSKVLDVTLCEKDLGVNVDRFLNFGEHITMTVKKSRSIAAMLVRNISFKEINIMIPLFKGLVRPIIEYGNVVWCPFLIKDINIVEKVQRDFTRYIVGMKNLNYQERLKKLKLPSLEYRRLRGDMIETYKIVHNKYDPVVTNGLVSLLENKYNTRSTNSLQLKKSSFNKKQYQMFFSNRIINMWNSLSDETVTASNINSFKNKFDKTFQHIMYSTRIDKENK